MPHLADLTRKDVEELALLARLHLEPEELERLPAELIAILKHFDVLAAVDTTGVPPMTHAVPMDLRLRPDVVAPSLSVEEALRGAPKHNNFLFVVPSILPPGENEE
jgi:aspartyl-tRNA(Asn)/glutamyl-tRNA(Gln) amidotransferase subunit C